MSAAALVLGRRTFRSLHRHRNYRLFFGGQIVSLAGTWMQNIALAWLVIELSGSPLAVGALAFCRFLPFLLFGLVAGVMVDRFDTRRLLFATQGDGDARLGRARGRHARRRWRPCRSCTRWRRSAG